MTVRTLETARLLHIRREVIALLAALHLQKPDMTLLKKLSDHEWRSLLAFCDISHLTLLLALLPSDGLPDWAVERLKRNLADNALRFELVKAPYREAADAFAKAGIAHIVIKGFTQAPEYVAEPSFRKQTDLDIYCLPENIEPAQIALARLLAQKPWIVPIPGTTKLHRLYENLGAVAVELTPDDLEAIENADAGLAIQGARYPERLEQLTGR